MFAVLGFSVSINVLVSSVLPKFEGMLLVLHIVGFFAVMVPLVVLGPHGDAASVFKTFQNSGQWSSQVLSCFVGIIGNVVAFVGTQMLR